MGYEVMRGIEPWADLLACALAHQSRSLPVAVLHEAQRVFPLVEARASTAWIHASRPELTDFCRIAAGQPLRRERLVVGEGHASRLITRSGLVIVCVPQMPTAVRAFRDLVASRSPASAVLLYGPEESPGWSDMLSTESSSNWTMMDTGGRGLFALNPVARDRLVDLSLPTKLDTRFAHLLIQRFHGVFASTVKFEISGSRIRLRFRADPLNFIAAASDSLAHHIMVEGRALFNPRGLASVMLPWDCCHQARFLLRNVRDRVDDAEIAVDEADLRVSYVDYTEQGARLTVQLPPITHGRTAGLHLSISRSAVPADGFCDIGAAEFSAELE
jgi:hypothetical protein